MIKQYLAAITTLLTVTGLGAEPDQDVKGQHQDAHVHGLAELTLVLEGNTLELELESPAANIVGFEHRASTPEQRGLADEAKAILESPQALFTFAGTRCELKQANVDVSSVMNTTDDDHANHAEEDHHEKQHDHDTEHNRHSEAYDTHSEIRAHYHFDCKQGSELTAVSVKLLDHFPGIENLNAMWVTDSRQGAVKLTAQAKHIHLR